MEGYGNENPGAFQSTRPLRGATATTTSSVVHALFQPMRPLRGATAPLWRRSRRSRISTHAPLAGRDGILTIGFVHNSYFNPRAPCGARLYKTFRCLLSKYFNPRAPCGARPPSPPTRRRRSWYFNPRAPCGARQSITAVADAIREFQPTRPLRGATGREQRHDPQAAHFNPRAPCGARPFIILIIGLIRWHFNPRAPCGARPQFAESSRIAAEISTHAPLAGRDDVVYIDTLDDAISTHAPLAGRDLDLSRRLHRHRHFNPRAPCGARQRYGGTAPKDKNFNPRAPCGARRRKVTDRVVAALFQPTRPLRGATG